MRRTGFALALLLIGCSGSPAAVDGGMEDAGTMQVEDAGNNGPVDAGASADAGKPVDAGNAGMSSDAGACEAACINANMAAYMVFEGDELMQCGCKSSGPCASDCTTECASPSIPTDTSPCGVCLLGQEDMGSSSSCITAAAIGCLTASNCSAFLNCAEPCQ